MFNRLKKFTFVVLCLVAVMSAYVILLWTPMQNQDHSHQFHIGRSTISVRWQGKRCSVTEEGLLPGVRQEGWITWR